MGIKYNIHGPTRGMLNIVHIWSDVVKVVDEKCRWNSIFEEKKACVMDVQG